MKHVLVLDDEIDLAESVATSLQDNGYRTQTCSSVDEAILRMSKDKFDLIISDVRMPQKDGIEFFNSVKSELKDSSTAFVLMTGQTERISMQSAYDMGVDEFVSKPFDLDDLNLVVNLILKNNLKAYSGDEKFYKVTLTEFLLASVNDYDVYLKINDDYLCLARKGQELLSERLMNYYKKGMTHVYLSSPDFAKYIGMQTNISEVVKAKPLDKVKKIKLFNHFSRTVSESALNDHISEELFNKVSTSFENYTQISLENTEVFNLVNGLSNYDKDRSSKSVLVSFLAIAIFQQWKWTHPKHLSKIALAALLCDVGLDETKPAHQKRPIDMTPEERKVYEKHPLQSYMHISRIKSIPEEILYVVLQHHENDSGLGFPQKVAKAKLHPYSRVIHAIHEFIDRVEKISCRQSIKDCLDSMLSFQKKLVSQQVLKTLYIIFDLPVPQDLEDEPLPTDTPRMT